MMEPEGRRLAGGALILPVVGIALLILIILAIATMCGGGDDIGGSASNRTPTPEATEEIDASQPQAALAAFVQTTLNAEYAGSCDDNQGGNAAGKVCSNEWGERDGVRGYVLGMTLSEPNQWAFLENRGGTWQVVYAPKITPENRVVPGTPWPLKVGAQVEITGTGSCLNVRTEPGGTPIDCLQEGTRITLASGPRDANNLQWWQVEGRSGWVAADYLRYPDAKIDPTPAPRPVNTPAATPRP